MATESQEPKSGLIARLAAMAVVTLLLVHAGLVAYYDRMAKAEELRKLGAPEALTNLRADEKERLSAGATPIDKAMGQLVAQGRMGAGPAIVPTISRDVAPLQGWTKMPGDVPSAMTAPPPPPPEPVAAASDAGTKADAGPQKGGDAGRPNHR